MSDGTLASILDIILLLGIFAGVLGLTYGVTKKLAVIKQGDTKTKYMHIVEILPVAMGQAIYIIQIGEAYHVFTGTKERLEYAYALDALPQIEKEVTENHFKTYLNQYIAHKQEKQNEGQSIKDRNNN